MHKHTQISDCIAHTTLFAHAGRGLCCIVLCWWLGGLVSFSPSREQCDGGRRFILLCALISTSSNRTRCRWRKWHVRRIPGSHGLIHGRGGQQLSPAARGYALRKQCAADRLVLSFRWHFPNHRRMESSHTRAKEGTSPEVCTYA